ncbi:YojF family protein [Cohnella nanjingensis]|uniref:YojF family protein n=1 Tax=Cohnella nanjingensis TaxID=1387779 RepID=A0A7X0VH32_9BACL|nr:YojF family protein [Cohnella nanjingensis]MBB6673717.1 YojF family protein [Cohnella nanjingensis]
MRLIDQADVQQRLDRLKDQDLYIHLEMTTGAYAAFIDSTKHPAATFITNAVIRYSHGSVSDQAPYRVGLKMVQGWVYSEGLTHYEEQETERLILAGHDGQGKLIVSLQLGREPF